MPTEPLVTYAEAAAALGVSRSTLYRIIADGHLAPVTVPRHQRRIRQADIDQYVASKT